MGYPSLLLSFCLLCIDNVDVCVFILECKLIHIHFSRCRSHENPGKCEFFYCHVVMILIKNKTAVRKMIIEGREGWKQFIKASFHSSYFQVMKTEGEEIHQKAKNQLCTRQAGPGSCTRGRASLAVPIVLPRLGDRKEKCLTFLRLRLVSQTQEIGLFHSSGSFTTFSWEAKGSRPTPGIWQLPKGNACFAVEGGQRHALEKGVLSLWFSQGNRDQRSRGTPGHSL